MFIPFMITGNKNENETGSCLNIIIHLGWFQQIRVCMLLRMEHHWQSWE